MVVIRLARTGSKKNPFYHVVVADRRYARDGKFIENVGYFNPVARGKATYLKLEKDRIEHWISNGAQPSERVTHLIEEFTKLEGKEPEIRPTRAQLRQAQSESSAESAKKAAAKKAKEEAEAAAKAEAEKEKKEPSAEAAPAENADATEEPTKE